MADDPARAAGDSRTLPRSRPGRPLSTRIGAGQDLDRWRSDRPLVYTSEPFWGQTMPRLLRRQQRALATAALSLVVIVATARRRARQVRTRLCKRSATTSWAGSGTIPSHALFGFSGLMLRACWRSTLPASRPPPSLKEYEVLDPSDWRSREDVRALSRLDQDDLEVWLMEQVYLYCRVLADRPDSSGRLAACARDPGSRRRRPARSRPSRDCGIG